MYLEIVILRHLQARPCHGYELKRRVAATTEFVLHNNALYPALRRFEEAGAVRRTAEELPGRPPRHVYELTDVGRELLHDLVAELPDQLAGVEEEFVTRVGLFDDLAPAERAGVLDARERALTARRDHLRQLTGRADEDGLRWGALVTQELARRAEAELDWIARLRPLAAGEPAAPGGSPPHPDGGERA